MRSVMIIVVANSKGGVGKSTISVHLAAWLHQQGHSVILADCDTQHSSSEWIAEAVPGVRSVRLDNPDKILDALPALAQEADYVIADGPGSNTETSRALLLRADGSADYVHIPGGQLIGLLPRAHIASAVVRLDPGDTLVLYTDGLTEARTAPGADERFGEQALLDFARRLGPVIAAEAVAAVRDLLDTLGTGVEDDTAVLAVHAPRRSVGS